MYVYFNNFFPVTHKSCNINVYSSNSFTNSTAVLCLSLFYAASKVGKGLFSLGLLLAYLAAVSSWRVLHWPRGPCVPLSYWFESKCYLFQSSRIMHVFSIWKFPAIAQNILFSFSSKWSHLYFSFHDF